MHRHHAPVRIRVVHLVHGVHHDLLSSHAEPNNERHISIVGIEPILSGAEYTSGRDLNPLVSGATNLEMTLILLVERYRFLIE